MSRAPLPGLKVYANSGAFGGGDGSATTDNHRVATIEVSSSAPGERTYAFGYFRPSTLLSFTLLPTSARVHWGTLPVLAPQAPVIGEVGMPLSVVLSAGGEPPRS